MARNYSNLYGQESKQKDGVQYEVARLPLQDHVSTVRRFLCKNWKAFQVKIVMYTLYCLHPVPSFM